MKLRIATRASDLALWQARHIAARLREEIPGAEVTVEKYSTRGDREAGPLAEIGGQGLFTAEVDRALHEGRADLAVHSLKDLPIQSPDGLVLAAVPERAPTEDALVSHGNLPLMEIPAGGAVGSSSPRRSAYILSVRPDLKIVPLRGNVPTRLARVRDGELAATMLARAGLVRLGLEHEITELLHGLLPAPGQGALGIVATEGSEAARALTVLNHAETRTAVDAERAVLAGLGGGCSLPLGTLARPEAGGWRVSAVFFSEDGAAHQESHHHVDPGAAAAACVDGLLAAGALR